jgi:hypothetical protein
LSDQSQAGNRLYWRYTFFFLYRRALILRCHQVIRGAHLIEPPGSRTYPFVKTLSKFDANGVERSLWPGALFRKVDFRSPSSAFYYSERYESFRDQRDPTVRDYLNGRREHNPRATAAELHDVPGLQEWSTKMNLIPLLEQSYMNLSNGQSRRAKIAKTLLKAPEVLLLDEPQSKISRF